MNKKKSLKDSSKYADIFVNEDLTLVRSKMLGLIKRTKRFSAWTQNGKILCTPRRPPGAPQADRVKPISVETPEDLFHLGLDEGRDWNLADLGLHGLVEDNRM